MIVLCISPQLITSMVDFLLYPTLLDFVLILLSFFLIVFFFFLLKGYTIIGVDVNDFKRVASEILDNRKYKYEMNISLMIIKNQQIDLTIISTMMGGIVQVRYKGKKNRDILQSVAKELKTRKIKANYTFPIFSLFLALFISAIAVLLIIL